MAELDYGAPDGAAEPSAPLQGTEASMHAVAATQEGETGQAQAGGMELDDAVGSRPPKMYELPADMSVEASSTRDVRPTRQMDEVDELLMPKPEDGEWLQSSIVPQTRQAHTSYHGCRSDLTPKPLQPNESVLDEVPLSQVRLAVLNLSGQPITQLSTSRIFAYLTHYGAAPLGIEWIDDQSCNVVFKDHQGSRLALEYLMIPKKRPLAQDGAAGGNGQNANTDEELQQEEEFSFGGVATANNEDGILNVAADEGEAEMEPISTSDPAEIPLPDPENMDKIAEQQTTFDENLDVEMGIALLTCRKVRPVPFGVFTPVERDLAEEMAYNLEQDAAKAAAASRIKAEAEEQDTSGRRQPEDDRPAIYREMEEEERQRSKMDPKFYNFRRLTSSLYARFSILDHDVKQSKANQRSEWYRSHGRDAGREVVERLLTVGDFKDSLELLPGQEDRRVPAMDRLGGSGRTIRGRFDKKSALDALNEEMDDHRSQRGQNRGRSASPTRDVSRELFPSGGGSGIRIKGRGSMRAPRPNAWGDENDEAEAAASGAGNLVSDQLEQRLSRRQGDRWKEDGPRERPLQDRLGVAPGTKFADRVGKSALLSDRLN